MKRVISIFAVLLLWCAQLHTQDSSNVESLSIKQNAALYTMAGIIMPLAIAGTVISVAPPSGGFIIREGTLYSSFSIESGYGEGALRETGEFTDYRISAVYTHILSSKVRDLYKIELKRDFHFEFIDRRKIFLSGFHFSAGFFSDLPNHGYTVGAGTWIKSPWLPFFGLFPSHTYGITYRFHKLFSRSSFHEISLGVTSVFTF